MANNSGIIYDLQNGKYGLALNKDQHENFKKYGKVFLHVYLDKHCTIPETCIKTGKKYVTLKNITTIKAIGFSD